MIMSILDFFKGLFASKAEPVKEVDEVNKEDLCDESWDIPEMNTKDDQIDALVLFADVDFLDPKAVEARKQELTELFGG